MTSYGTGRGLGQGLVFRPPKRPMIAARYRRSVLFGFFFNQHGVWITPELNIVFVRFDICTVVLIACDIYIFVTYIFFLQFYEQNGNEMKGGEPVCLSNCEC